MKQKTEAVKKQAATVAAKSPQPRKSAVQTGKGNLAASPLKAAKASKGDVFEQEMKELEKKIIEQILQLVTYQEIWIGTRQYRDAGEFSAQILLKLHQANKKKERVEQVMRYITAVTALSDSEKNSNNLEGQAAARGQSRGARIMNAVLSGNLMNTIDIYHSNPPQSGRGNAEAYHETEDGELGEGQGDEAEENKAGPEQAAGGQNRYGSPRSLHTAGGGGSGATRVLSASQRGLNYLINYLSQICDQEDILSSNRVLKQCPLFYFGQMAWVEYNLVRNAHLQRCNEQHAVQNLVNIYEIQQTTVQRYLESYERHSLFVKRDLFEMLTKTDQSLLMAQFYEIISKTATSLVKSVINKIDDVFCGAVLDDEEKTEFSNSQTKIRRQLDQDMRTFREYLDAEANKRLTEVHESAHKQQEIKLTHSVTALKLLVRIYYLK